MILDKTYSQSCDLTEIDILKPFLSAKTSCKYMWLVSDYVHTKLGRINKL